MKRLVLSVLMLVTILSAEEIDVLIKGFDDGVKSTKQQDYKEAVMSAKQQAIERAGSKIEANTKVENFQLKYQAIESQANGVLLPGFTILDLGYQKDGTYQVILNGKIKIGEGSMQSVIFNVDEDMKLFVDNKEYKGSDIRVLELINGKHKLMIIKPSKETLSIGSGKYQVAIDPKKNKLIYKNTVNISENNLEFDFTSHEYLAYLNIKFHTTFKWYTCDHFSRRYTIYDLKDKKVKIQDGKIKPGKYSVCAEAELKTLESGGLFSRSKWLYKSFPSSCTNITLSPEQHTTVTYIMHWDETTEFEID